MCTHRLAGGALVCDRADAHDEAADGGHTYSSSTGSAVPDEHTTSEGTQD